MIDQKRLYEIESHCTQESPPRCRAACPFDLDVKAFMAAMARGDVAGARRTLERHIPLPALMARLCDHPCEGVCLREDRGGAVAIGDLERFCMAADVPPGRTLPMPPKRRRMAVAGLGLAGIVAAADLAAKAFPLTILHEGDPGDVLRRRCPSLAGKDADVLAAALETLAKKAEFVQGSITPESAAALAADHDAVLLDADAAPNACPPIGEVDPATHHWKDNICCAGYPVAPGSAAAPSVSALAGQGRSVSHTMERVAGGVSLTAAREEDLRTPAADLSEVADAPRVEPKGGSFDADEARKEAERCLQCECLRCVRECVFLQKYKGHPRIHARQIFNNLSIVKGLHTANRTINGCALCGRCTALCPENFSMAELCLEARQEMVDRDKMPPSAFEFALEDMENASGPDCALTLPAPDSGKHVDWLLFPGCQLAASRGDQVAELRTWLERALRDADGPFRGSLGVMLSCCGIPARWAGHQKDFEAHTARLRADWEALGRPGIAAACSSCLDVIRKHWPGAEAVSLWEMIDALPWPENAPERPAALRELCAGGLSVQDPCGARHDDAWRKAARSLAARAGVRVEEPALTGERTGCCGYGGLLWCSQPELGDAMGADRASELPLPALTSCVMCRDRLVASGKPAIHLLDLLPHISAAPVPADAPGPGLSARRFNRADLRRRLLGVAQDAAAEGEGVALLIPDAVLEAMERAHILVQDVRAAVAGVEAGGTFFVDAGTGRRMGSWRPRNVTFWVEYVVDGPGRFILHDAWRHRMRTRGSGGTIAGEAGKEVI